MEKIIVVIKKDGGVILIHPNPKYYGEGEGLLPITECPALKLYTDPNDPAFVGEVCDFVVITKDQMPSYEDRKKMESRKQLFWNKNKKRIDIDWEWENRVMSKQLILRKEISDCTKKIEAESAKESPDILMLFKLKEKIEKMRSKDFSDKEAYQIALDALASRGESSKKKIKTKLEELISSLS